MKLGMLLLLITGSFLANAQPNTSNQPLEVLFIAASHNYGKNMVEQFDYPINKALAFRPDAVFSEDLSPEDFDALTDYWNMANVKSRLAYLEKLGYAAPKNPDTFIRKTYKLLRDHPNYHQDRMKLARALYLKHDFGNARYQLYRLDKAKTAFGNEEIAAYRAILGEPDSLYRSRSSEYHNIFFPILDKLQQDRIFPMDCQKYDVQWSEAWGKTDSLYKVFETALDADTNSADYRKYQTLINENNALQRSMNAAAKAGKSTEFLNTADWDKLTDYGNFYGNRYLFGLKGFPEEGVGNMLKYWTLRNECMCQNIVNRARQMGAKRVVVGVGASHRELMVKLLKATPGVTVYTLNEYQP